MIARDAGLDEPKRPSTVSFLKGRRSDTTDLKLNGMKILLAEDGPDNQRLFSHILRKAGATITVVGNGRQAVECLTKDGTFEDDLKNPSPYDLLLTDMQMPVMDGYDATKYLRNKGATLPIVALTANVMSSDIEKCLHSGCDDYASKPIDKISLIETCEKWWQSSQDITDLRRSVVELHGICSDEKPLRGCDPVASYQI